MTPGINAASKAGISHSIHEYEHDPASAGYGNEAADKLGVEPARIFKTLVVAIDGTALAVGVVPVTSMLSMKLIAKAAGGKKASMADPQEVQRRTGYVLGGVSPLGQKNRLKTFIDASAESFDTVYISAGRRGLEIELSPADLAKLTGGQLVPLQQAYKNPESRIAGFPGFYLRRPGELPGCHPGLLHRCASIVHNPVEGFTRLHHRLHLVGSCMVVTTDICRITLDNTHFFQDLVLVLFQLCRHFNKELFQFLVAVLIGQLFCPVARQVEVAATVVQLPGDTRRRLVVFQQAFGGLVEGLAKQACTVVVVLLTQLIQRHSNSQKLTQ